MYELKNVYTHTANIFTCFSKTKNGIPNYKFINEMHIFKLKLAKGYVHEPKAMSSSSPQYA